MHFAVFSKSWPPSPLSGLPFAAKTHILPLAPISCHPGEVGLWPTDQLQSRAVTSPVRASGSVRHASPSPASFPLGWGPPASRLETYSLILQALFLDAPPKMLMQSWSPPPPPCHRPGMASQIQPLLAHSPQPTSLTMSAAEGGRQSPPSFMFPHQGSISASQPWLFP